jgi:hypothetical protein
MEFKLHACLEGTRLVVDGCPDNIIVETDNLELTKMVRPTTLRKGCVYFGTSDEGPKAATQV